MVRGAIGAVLTGALIVVVTALGMAQLPRHFRMGVAPGDLVTLVSVPLLLCGIAILALRDCDTGRTRTGPTSLSPQSRQFVAV